MGSTGTEPGRHGQPLSIFATPKEMQLMHVFADRNLPKKVFSVLSLALVFLGTAACGFFDPTGTEPAGPDPEQGDLLVLFIGSSYFDNNDLPGMVQAFAENAGKQMYVRRLVISGMYLDFFADNVLTDQVVEEQEWDYVVLQGGCQNAAYPDSHHEITPGSGYHPVYPALELLKDKVEANHPDTKLVYMMPWAFEDGMTWVDGMTDTYDDMQQKIHDNALAWADSLEIALAPVGWAWREVLSEEQEQHYLHVSDWNHPSWRGSYLSASVIFTSLFRESPEGLTYFAGLDQKEARGFLSVASSVVLDSLELWNLTP